MPLRILNFVLLVLALNACTYKSYKTTADTGSVGALDVSRVDFAMLRSNIFSSKTCSSCHGSSSSNVDLSIYENVLKYVDVGNPEGSVLYRDISSGRMPKNLAPLPQNLVNAVYEWIKKGAPLVHTDAPIEVTEDRLQPTYASVYKKIIFPKCVSCHSPCDPSDKNCSKPDLDFTTYEKMTTNVLYPDMVKSGKPEDSDLYKVLKDDFMPMDSAALSDEEKSAIHEWILSGGKEN